MRSCSTTCGWTVSRLLLVDLELVEHGAELFEDAADGAGVVGGKYGFVSAAAAPHAPHEEGFADELAGGDPVERGLVGEDLVHRPGHADGDRYGVAVGLHCLSRVPYAGRSRAGLGGILRCFRACGVAYATDRIW